MRKLALLGAGGTRAPLFARALARRVARHGRRVLLALHDVDRERATVLGGLAAAIAERESDGLVSTSAAARLEEAVEGADYVVTSIRAGGDASRAEDERIALAHGVLAQETTGAGGLAMAMRSAPALLAIAEAVAERAPAAWTLHFTNPAGLVTQVLIDAGHDRQLGICDSPSDLVRRVAAFLGSPVDDVAVRIAGLNHLSWLVSVTTPATTGADERLPALLADDAFVRTVGAPFEPDFLRALGVVPSEYLHYYHHRDVALRAQRAAPATRGADLVRANAALVRDLAAIDPSGRYDGARLDDARARHARYESEREASYRRQVGRADVDAGAPDPSAGYAGIALDVIEALATGAPRTIVLSVRNARTETGPAIPLLAESDVVEACCRVDASGATPLPLEHDLPDDVEVLLATVKVYERLAARAIRDRDRALAVRALTTHPLVGSYPLAGAFVDATLAAHVAHVGTGWR